MWISRGIWLRVLRWNDGVIPLGMLSPGIKVCPREKNGRGDPSMSTPARSQHSARLPSFRDGFWASANTMRALASSRLSKGVCDQCGRDISLPRLAPRRDRRGRSYPKFLHREGAIEWPPIPEDEIERFETNDDLATFLRSPRNWPQSGDHWDQYEINAMLQIIGKCSCGGKWEDPKSPIFNSHRSSITPHPLCRCPYCRSRNFSTEQAAIYD